ncbi:MAG: FkbM family methyltransferase [Chloroflexota bacterium]
MAQNWLQKLRGKAVRRPTASFDQVTEEDIYYCYRLFLRREPDEQGLRSYRDLMRKDYISLKTLTEGFLHSKEFLSLHGDTPIAAIIAASHQIQLVELPDFKMYVRGDDLFIGRTLAAGQQYEPYLTNEIRQHLQPETIFVDIGANIGYFTLTVAAALKGQGKVFAFEPNLDNAELLKLSVAANGFTNVELFPHAVTDKEEYFVLETDGSNGWIKSMQQEMAVGATDTTVGDGKQYFNGGHFLVKSVVLDEVLADVDHIDIIKMDVEGAEPRVLQGMCKLLQKHRPIIFTEFAPGMIDTISHTTPEAYLQSFQDLGYTLFAVQTDTTHREALTTEQVMKLFSEKQLNHIDLAAFPK